MPHEVRAGSRRSCRQPGGCSPRSARCPSSCSGTTTPRSRSKTAARTSGSRCTRARSRPGSSRVTGITRASTSCRAARSTSGPTTPAGSTSSIRGDDVFVTPAVHADPVGHLQTRLRNGLEDDISLVVAKSVLGLLEAGVPASEIVRTGVEFGARYRDTGLGRGPHGARRDGQPAPPTRRPTTRRSRSCTASRSSRRDTRNHAPRFAVGALETQDVPVDRLGELVPALRRHPLVRRGRAHARNRARRARPPRPRSRR